MNLTHPDPQYQILLPHPSLQLSQLFNQLKLFSKQRLDTDSNPQHLLSQSQIKGLKFISSKLAKLFSKNRKLPYTEISKILIDNFAHEQKDQRNIKRRVYDAINVLVAAGILVKKNNSIQMIKHNNNRINRGRFQNRRKDKIQEEIKQKEEKLGVKKEMYGELVKKHKMIKKLFDRNINHTSSLLGQRKMKKTRTRNDQTLKQPKCLTSITPSNIISLPQTIITHPRLFIFTTEQVINKSNKKSQHSLLTSHSQNHLQMIVPLKKSNIHNNTKIYEPILLEEKSPFKKRNWMVGMEENNNNQMEQQQEEESMIIKQYQKDCIEENNYSSEENNHNNKQQKAGRFIMSEYGIYTLLELLELLTLNQTHQQ